MNQESIFQKRIGYSKNLEQFLETVCTDYDIGKFISHRVAPVGYEDFNFILKTSKGKYFVKIFADFRNDKDCQRYINILDKVIKAGVSHPKIYQFQQGGLYQKVWDGYKFRLTLMEYIDGLSFFEGNLSATEDEMRYLVNQTTVINSIDLKPELIYDSWAIVNFLKEYNQKKTYLKNDDLGLIKPLVKEFKSLAIEKLPHCFIHGDIIKTNVLKDKEGKLYIIDFSVCNYYPRIQELAVLLCNMLFDEKNPNTFPKYYKLALGEYQRIIQLTPQELETLPLFVKLAHAMHIVCGTYEKKANQNLTQENDYWINLGKIGLKYTSSWDFK
ncbi:MAG: phosphotransferase [Patescibacteria group bacterium]